MGEILTRLVLLIPAFSLLYAPPVLTNLASLRYRTLLYPLPPEGGKVTASVARFSPVTFSARDGIDQ